jgi:hypothetical protein
MSELRRTTSRISPHSHVPCQKRPCGSNALPYRNSMRTPNPPGGHARAGVGDRSHHISVTADATTHPPKVPVTPRAGFRSRRMHGLGWGALRVGPLGYTWAAATWTSLASACAFAHALLGGSVRTPTMATILTPLTAIQGENDDHMRLLTIPSPSRDPHRV